jgi:hypothetical protein
MSDTPKEDKIKTTETKMVTMILDYPFMTNGVPLGWETIDGKAVFTGKVEVTEDVAEDLARRMKENQKYRDSLMTPNGKTIDAAPGGISVGGV